MGSPWLAVYLTAFIPLQSSLLPITFLELAIHTKVVHGVDVGNFPAILHSGPLPHLSYGMPLSNEKVIRTGEAY